MTTPTILNEKLEDWDLDLAHIGDLCKPIRKSRDISATDIAKSCEPKLKTSTITRLEKKGNPEPENFFCYLQALQSKEISGKPVRKPLNKPQAGLLKNIYDAGKLVKIFQKDLTYLDFKLIKPKRSRPDGLTDLIEELKKADNPTFIIDPFWFIHAMNGSLLLLFDLDPTSEYFYHWQAWHVLGTKFLTDSPVRLAHINTDEYFPPTIDLFFRSTHQFLFTIQMRMLVWKLHLLSSPHDLKFTDWWYSAITFNLHYELKALTRTIKHQGKEIKCETIPGPLPVDVEVMPGIYVPYLLVTWYPKYPAAQKAFAKIRQHPDSQKIFYAADYDLNNDFHVNCWPEVEEKLKS